MPLYMDRHENQVGLTPKDVAEGHLQDIKIQDKYNCKFLTYWFDEYKCSGFCLVEAPNKEAVEEVHRNSHGMVPNRVIEVNKNLVELFLGRISDPESPNPDNFENYIDETAFRTIMNVELIYPSFIYLKPTEDETNELLSYCNEVFYQALERYEGREIHKISEGFLASFSSVTNSIRCAVEIQNCFKEFNDKSNRTKINIAVGLHTGLPVTDKGGFFEETIQFVKRICSIADKDKIVVSSTIRDLINAGKVNATYIESIKVLNPSEEKFLNQLMDLTEQIWNDERFNLDNFSKQIGLSKAQLYRKVTSLTGYSPNVFIREYRLKKALKAIEKMKGNISEIALESGFNNPSYFSKCFQKRFGILPSEYANTIA